jgi:hypothetical protein
MRCGMTLNGLHVSATMAMATVVHTRSWRSCTRRLFSSVMSTSCKQNERKQISQPASANTS